MAKAYANATGPWLIRRFAGPVKSESVVASIFSRVREADCKGWGVSPIAGKVISLRSGRQPHHLNNLKRNGYCAAPRTETRSPKKRVR